MTHTISILKQKMSRAKANLAYLKKHKPDDLTEEQYRDILAAHKDTIQYYNEKIIAQ